MSTGSPGEGQTPELTDWDELETTSQSWSIIDSDHDSDLHPGLKALSRAASAKGSNSFNSNSNATTTYPNPFFAILGFDIYSMLPEPTEEDKFYWYACPILLRECDRSPGLPKFRKLVVEYESTICEGLKVRADKYREEKTGQQCEEPEGENQSMDEEIAQDHVGQYLVAGGTNLASIYNDKLMKSYQERNDLKVSLSEIPQKIKKLREEYNSKQ